MKLAERTRPCARCQRVKPWSDYHPRTQWPNGTMRTPQSYCKPCQTTRVAEWRERNRARHNARRRARWAEIREREPERYRRILADDLDRRRKRRGIVVPMLRDSTMSGERVPVGPFRAWLVAHPEAQVHVPQRTLYAILSGERRFVYESMVDAVLCAEGSVTLSEVYAA